MHLADIQFLYYYYRWFQDCDGYNHDGEVISMSNKWYFTSGAYDDRMCVKECDGPEEYCGGAGKVIHVPTNICMRKHL